MSINSFKSKVDYYGLSASGIVLVSTSENKKASVAEAKGENGFVVADLMYGQQSSPSQEYVVKANASLNNIVLGKVNTVDDKCYCLESITVASGAGSVPKITVSGKQVENNATDSCTASLSGISVTGLYHAQTFGAFTFSGAGVHLTKSNLAAKCTIATAEKDGEPLSHDITDGRVTVNGTLQVSDSSYPTPTLSAASGWEITSPITEVNPDGDFPTYTFTLTKYLTATEPSV